MKQLYTKAFIILLFSVLIPNKILCANDNQLITEIKIIDNDSSFRYLYLYDKLGNKVLETKYFQQDSIWIRKSLNEWIYDGNNCMTQRERIWKNNDWMISYTIDYEYKNNQLISEIHNIYNNGSASLLKKIEFQYDKAMLTSKNEYTSQSNAWVPSIKNDFSYSKTGLTNSITTSNSFSGNTDNQLISTFLYNSDGTVQSQLLQNKVANNLANSELINWYYLPNSSLIASLRNKIWISDTSSWENTQRIDYIYNDSTKLVSETYQRWKSMFWENDIRYDYLYDNSNKLLRKTLSKPIYNDWRGLTSINYSNFTMNKAVNIDSKYEFWGGKTDLLMTSYIPFLFNNEMSIQKGRSLKISYIPITNTALYTPLENNLYPLIPVYPNPSNGIYYINTQTYNIKSWSVTDLNGQILKKQVQTLQSGAIDLTDFPKGIYIFRVLTQDGQMIQKLIKE